MLLTAYTTIATASAILAYREMSRATPDDSRLAMAAGAAMAGALWGPILVVGLGLRWWVFRRSDCGPSGP